MQPYRSILFTILVVGVSTIVLTSAGICEAPSHDASFGKRTPADRLIYRDRITEGWTFFGFSEKYLTFPLKGQEKKNISVIEIIDQYVNGNGGCFTIKKGGVGFDHVVIQFTALFMRGLDFIVKIYGVN